MSRRRRKGDPIHGAIVVDKASGPTSFDVVAQVRRLTRAAKAGHAGTLDPLASGLLVVCLGEGTKAVPWLMDAAKSYRATLKLGATTDTLDSQGQILAELPIPELDEARIEQALGKQRGTILQVPPMVSALKRDGERLYEKARRGEEVELEGRPVRVDELRLVSWEPTELVIEVTCGKGFYVRALARDIGEDLGCGAHLTALRRTATAGFHERDAHDLEALSADPPTSWTSRLLTPATLLGQLESVTLDADEETLVRNGGARPPLLDRPDGVPIRLLDAAGNLVAVAVNDLDRGRLQPKRVFLPH